jgi:hypothetical protein
VQEAGWAPGPVWTGAENLAPTGIRSPDRPTRSSVATPTELPDPHACNYRVFFEAPCALDTGGSALKHGYTLAMIYTNNFRGFNFMCVTVNYCESLLCVMMSFLFTFTKIFLCINYHTLL